MPRTGTTNPICGYEMHPYTTPCPSFDGDSLLNIYLFLSHDYISGTRMVEVINLLTQLTARRWLYPCRQYRKISFTVYLPRNGWLEGHVCIVEDIRVDGQGLCSAVLFSSWFDELESATSARNITCADHYDPLFNQLLKEPSLAKNKYLLITDLPMTCANSTQNVSTVLTNYIFYATGAPLTVIAIDKIYEKSVANSYAPLFPPTQRPNLYKVNNISELLPNINETINFCLDSVPGLEQRELPYDGSNWYLFLIGAVILIALVVTVAVFIIIRNKKRKENQRGFRERMQMVIATIAMDSNRYAYNPHSTAGDIWEIPLKSLDIHYKVSIGKGAFSIVHAGFLHGKAPVRDVYPSIALQKYVDCDVAVKTLPQHYNETERARFHSEIRLMKDVGYHVHLVSMLGSNCSIERPFLVMELAEQSLLHWLHNNSASMFESEINLEKSLLSISWQVSDGMSYLSSKHFVHRDLAARNVLLTKESKAMVSDFGLCQKLDHAEQLTTIPGGKLPLKWMALESLKEHQFSVKTDLVVWCILYEIFGLGEEPYGNISGEDLLTFLQEGKRLQQPKLASGLISELMKLCWHVDPAMRPSFAKIQTILGVLLEDSTGNYGYLPATENETE